MLNTLQRSLPHQASNPAWVRDQLNKQSTRILLLHNDENLVTQADPAQAVMLRREQCNGAVENATSITMLGWMDKSAYFALGIPSPELLPKELLSTHGDNAQFVDLRKMLPLLQQDHVDLLGFAKSMNHWHMTSQYCGACGNPTRATFAGRVRKCTNKDCALETYPRVSPAAIVLAEHNGTCLLGRQATWPEGMFSAIAGFVEPGESMEQAALRELWEETGIVATKPRYLDSQPWPFPHSLMAAFIATATTTNINMHDQELEEARWFTPEELQHVLQRSRQRMPKYRSISYHLMETWLNAQK